MPKPSMEGLALHACRKQFESACRKQFESEVAW